MSEFGTAIHIISITERCGVLFRTIWLLSAVIWTCAGMTLNGAKPSVDSHQTDPDAIIVPAQVNRYLLFDSISLLPILPSFTDSSKDLGLKYVQVKINARHKIDAKIIHDQYYPGKIKKQTHVKKLVLK